MRGGHRRNNRDLNKRHKIRCVSFLNNRNLPVPLRRRLHYNRVGSPLAPDFKRVHSDPIFDRRFAASLVLPQPDWASLFAVGSCALCHRLRRGWRIPHEALLEYVNDLPPYKNGKKMDENSINAPTERFVGLFGDVQS